MSHEDREALLEAFSAAWSAKDLDALMDLMTDDCQFRASVGAEPGTTFTGRDEVRRGYGLFVGPEATGPAPESEETVALTNGDFAVTRWTLRFAQPDGGYHEVRGCDVFEFEGDRIKLKDTYRKVPGSL
jgi:ketosteroid isomerase-like protein